MDLKLGSLFGYKETFWVVNAIFACFSYLHICIDSSLFIQLEQSEDVEIKHDLIIPFVYRALQIQLVFFSFNLTLKLVKICKVGAEKE